MKPQNQVEGAVPLLALIVVVAIALLSLQAAFITSLVFFVLFSAYLFIRREW
jgi:cell division protein FtsW (lipid II flippase)